MSKYRKRPVVIDAVQLTQEVVIAYCFDSGPLPLGVICSNRSMHPGRREIHYISFRIQTLEGRIACDIGDWIITGVKGERYACKPDIFVMTYEAVAD